MQILDFIPYGEENAVTGKELQQITGLDTRSIKQNIANARLKGAVICSILDGKKGGYFLPNSPEEAVAYVRTEQCRIASAREALKAAEEYISECEAEVELANEH